MAIDLTRLSWKQLVIIVVLTFVVLSSIGFVSQSKIRIVDKFTGNPLSDIDVKQDIYGRQSTIVDSNRYTIRQMTQKTNSEGYVVFPSKLFIGNPLKVLEAVRTNALTSEDYYGKFPRPVEGKIIVVEETFSLSPKVSDLSECMNDEECVTLNAYDLAIANNDESLCMFIVGDNYGDESYRTAECLRIIAQEKDNALICDKIPGEEGMSKRSCYFNIAVSTHNLPLCDKLPERTGDAYNKPRCLEMVMVY